MDNALDNLLRSILRNARAVRALDSRGLEPLPVGATGRRPFPGVHVTDVAFDSYVEAAIAHAKAAIVAAGYAGIAVSVDRARFELLAIVVVPNLGEYTVAVGL